MATRRKTTLKPQPVVKAVKPEPSSKPPEWMVPTDNGMVPESSLTRKGK